MSAAVIEAMALDNANSDFALSLREILRTRKIYVGTGDEEPVTAELVAEAVNEMTM